MAARRAPAGSWSVSRSAASPHWDVHRSGLADKRDGRRSAERTGDLQPSCGASRPDARSSPARATSRTAPTRATYSPRSSSPRRLTPGCRPSATTRIHTARSSDFDDCYDRSWGAAKERTNPAIGDHEYETPNAAGYFGYFAERLAPLRSERPGPRSRLLQLRASGPGTSSSSTRAARTCRRAASNVSRCVAGAGSRSSTRAGARSRCSRARAGARAMFTGTTERCRGTGTASTRQAPTSFWAATTTCTSATRPRTLEARTTRAEGCASSPSERAAAACTDSRPWTPTARSASERSYGILKLALLRGGYAWEFVAAGPTRIVDGGSDRCH